MSTEAAFPGRRDSPCAAAERSGMIERVATEGSAMGELTAHGMSTGESAASHDVDRSRIVTEGQIHARPTPHTGDDARREDRTAQIDAVVVAEADAEGRIPRLAPAQRNPAHRIHHAHHFNSADKRN